MLVRRVAATGLALLAAATACGSAGGAATTGLRGTVVRGPTQPVCRIGEPCSEPAARVALVFRRSGRTVRTKTDARGRYRVALAPGTWQVSTGTRLGMERIRPLAVRVVAGRFRAVRFSIDTGIR